MKKLIIKIFRATSFSGLLVSLILTCEARQPVDVRESFGDHSYRFVPYPRPWHLAKQDAEKQGGYLVVINQPAEQEFVSQLIRKGANGNIPPTWIGLNDQDEEGHWKWVNGEKVEFFSWFDGEPNNHNGAENAVFIAVSEQGRIGWNDCYSDARLHYLIEFDQTQPASASKNSGASSPRFGGSRYELVSQPKTWREAQKHARNQGGRLVVIDSAEEQAFLEALIKNQEGKQIPVWIGLSDEDDEGQWEWVDGSEPRYTNWGPGNPDNGYGLQDYAWIGWYGDGRWDDLQPDAQLAFVIEYPEAKGKNTATGSLRRTR